MPKGLLKSVKSYAKNAGLLAFRVLARRASARDAWGVFIHDSRKMRQLVAHSERRQNHKFAAKQLEAGRKRYNHGDYKGAEAAFRGAWQEDEKYALAVAYLGNALYKQQRYEEATKMWERAYQMDPSSEGGEVALAKLQHLEHKQSDALAQLKGNR